ncbi:hypothetical protein FMM05_19150 [Flavobacterium zepuense]|uniref:Uncharacterized protein n=1 Tax=Flavobacterium zepuense TaxID=2593302 RepID=A0A552UV43_9FLAO|nr:hypothetical protein [Flavobacterium zepuense]TRW22067.1 hypothetical protein FMM05_19150 [Flavobacterium zepuense]
MRFIKKYTNARLLCLLIALHILNFSIDNPHTLFEHNKVDTDFNEVDSVVELVLEDVMNIDNAIPEHHSKTPLTNKFNAKKVVWTFEHYEPIVFKEAVAENYKEVFANNFYSNPIYNSPLVNIFSPPPQA